MDNPLAYIHQSNLIESVDNPREDAQSLLAWEYINSVEEVGISELLETHRLITVNQLNRQAAGHFRSTFVQVGGEVAPSPWLSQQLIHNLLFELATYPQDIDPINDHIRFEKAHPFIDGNGRTGRMLMWYHQIRIGQTPWLVLNDTKEKDYYPIFRR
jgi:Fic family protein